MILHNISGSTYHKLTFYDYSNNILIDIPFTAGNVTLDDIYRYHPVIKKLIEDELLEITSYDGLSPDEEDAIKESESPSAENVVITTSALPEIPEYPADDLSTEDVSALQGLITEGDGHAATIGDLKDNNVFTENLGIICSSSLEDASGVHQLLEVPSSITATPTKIGVCCVKADASLVAGSRTLNLKIGSTLYPIVLAYTDGVVGTVKEATIAEGIEKANTANWIVETLTTEETAFTPSATTMWNFYVTYTKSI